MQETGPVFVSVKVTPEVQNLPIGLRQGRPSRSRTQAVNELREELGIELRLKYADFKCHSKETERRQR